MISLGRLIDRVVGLFNPHAEFKRAAYRMATRSQYAAAKGDMNMGGWSPTDHGVNTVIGNSSTTLRARARQLVRDMPAMATALQRVQDFTVGDGISLQARVKNRRTGKLDKTLNQQIEDAWQRWCESCDAGGRLHFNEMVQLACRQEIEVGEYVFLKRFTRAGGKFLPFDLLAIEPDQLSHYGATSLPGNEISQGVEYDPRTGKAVAYHFEDPERWSKPQRFDARNVVLGYKTDRPNQLRGVTPLAPVILLAHQLRDYLEAEISSAQRAARWLAFVTSDDPAATMQAMGGSLDTDSAGNSHYTQEMGHAIIDYLRTGEQVTVANHNRPGDNFEPFVRFILRSFAAAVGTTYELVSGDYTGAQYSASRVSRNDMLKGIDIRRGRLIRQFCEPIKREFMFWAVMTGRIYLPDYMANQEHYNRCVWMAPGVESLDPLREGRAESDAKKAQLRSPQEILLARGRDPEQVLDEIEEWKQMLADRDLIEEPEAAPLASSPAAVADQGEQGEKKILSIGEKRNAQS